MFYSMFGVLPDVVGQCFQRRKVVVELFQKALLQLVYVGNFAYVNRAALARPGQSCHRSHRHIVLGCDLSHGHTGHQIGGYFGLDLWRPSFAHPDPVSSWQPNREHFAGRQSSGPYRCVPDLTQPRIERGRRRRAEVALR